MRESQKERGSTPDAIAPQVRIDKTHLASGAQIRSATGASYEVASSTHNGQREESVTLSSGRLELNVPALGQGTLSVKTHDATVLVHGTEFSVEVLTHQGRKATKVDVTEGLVSVRCGDTQEFLRPGTSWISSNTQAPGAEPMKTSPAPVPPRSSQSGSSSSPNEEPPSEASGTLVLENALYARAMQLKLKGDYEGARSALDELTRNYPHSPLNPSAEKAKAKLNELDSAGLNP